MVKISETVKTLTKNFEKLKVKFDRASYRAAYDKVYFRRTVECPHCGEIKVKHMLKRHMKTAKCKRIRAGAGTSSCTSRRGYASE
jgi:hypothetical protein